MPNEEVRHRDEVREQMDEWKVEFFDFQMIEFQVSPIISTVKQIFKEN